MKSLITSIAASLLIISTPSSGKPIYKCQFDGEVKFTEEPCDATARAIELKGIAASLEPFDMSKVKDLDAAAKTSAIKARIALREKRIHQYLVKMNKELDKLDGKGKKSRNKGKLHHSVRDMEVAPQLKSIAMSSEAALKGNLAEQRNVVVNHYKALIEVEQFHISVLLKKLHVLRVVEGTEIGSTD